MSNELRIYLFLVLVTISISLSTALCNIDVLKSRRLLTDLRQSSLHALPPLTPEVIREGYTSSIQFLDSINLDLEDDYNVAIRTVMETISGSIEDLQSFGTEILPLIVNKVDPLLLEALKGNYYSLKRELFLILEQHPVLYSAFQRIGTQLNELFASHESSLQLVGSGLFTYAIVSSFFSLGQDIPPNSPYPLKKYDSSAARAYFDRKFPIVIRRALQISIASLGFGLKIGKDYVMNELNSNAEVRALELAELLSTLGPSFIKIGQSLSIRTDLLSPEYVRGLKTLQDQVPPFETSLALRILQEEWGSPVESILSEISSEPVAAASLGQVYRARLMETGQEVAIKVLRPNIEGQIALDMYILRELAPFVKRTFNLNTDLGGVVDTWGAGFVDELDYLSEAENSKDFMKGIEKTELKDVVFAPPVVDKLSTEKILTTEWIIGERLDRSDKDDVTALCSVAMNTYLTMMLELGTLHSDPHPGNLLRTPDGRLCILDWGMVTRLDKDLQLTLITHMAHLTSRDYEEIPRDLLLLGFIPQSKANLIEDSGIVEVLADIYGAWTDGGGAASINVNKVISQLQDLTATKGNLFQIPPYFAYIAKCFSVLEGIGLSNDSRYSIINECLPYVSKRLLTDKDARTGAALSTFIFGPDKHNLGTRLVDYKRVEQLVEGFSSYTSSSSGIRSRKENLTRTQLLESSADQVLELVFSDDETPLQSILIEQVAKIIGASSRSIWAEILEASGTLPTGRTVLGTLVDPFGLWRTSPLIRMNKMDAITIETTQKLITLVQSQVNQSNNPMLDLSTVSRDEAMELAAIIASKVWERRRGVVKTGGRLAYEIMRLTSKKLESGDRGELLIPSSIQTNLEQNHLQTNEPKKIVEEKESDRLLNARQRLIALTDQIDI